jgi:hypothetical protein
MNMIRSLVIAVLGALAVSGVASAAYPSTFAVQGGTGVKSIDGSMHFVAAKAGENTKVSALAVQDDSLIRSSSIDGAYGVPMLGVHDVALGMFRDGSTFVLQSVGAKATTSFALIRTSDLTVRDTITLPGTFAFDALSPDGSTLYLIEHKSVNDLQHYVVRAYNLATHTLSPGRIADKTQKSWVMQGFAAARAVSGDGRWVYTLYANPGGYPFVHALDTVKGVAHCVGFAWKGDFGPLFDYSLSIHGNKLRVLRNDRSVYRVIDRTTWAVRTR